jgi:hypothetical protein
MSKSHRIKKDLLSIVESLDRYEAELSDWKENIILDNKNIEVVNIEQASWLAFYDEIKVQLKIMLDYMDYLLKEQKAKSMTLLYNTMQKSISDRAIEKLAEDNKKYKDLFLIYLEVKELYLLADSIVNQIQQRAYSINNIVKIREKELEGITLHLDQ